MSAQNTNNTQLRPQARKGNPLGAFFTFVFLTATAYGLFYLWQNKDNLSNMPFLSSLKLPGANNNVALSPDNQGQNYNTPPSSNTPLSQTQPIQIQQQNAQPIKHGGSKRTKASTNNETPPVASEGLKKTPENIVGSGYPPEGSHGFISYKSIVPTEGLLPDSIDSFIAYSTQDNSSQTASRPAQIIKFKTNFYSREKGLEFVIKKLAALGFAKISIPIDDYLKGGATVIEGIDNMGNQCFISFKPIQESSFTSWKAEIYKTPNH